MASSFPTTQAALAAAFQDDVDTVSGVDGGTTTNVGMHAAHHNALADEVNAVEAFVVAQDWHPSCRVASTANIAGTYAAGPPATKAVGGTTLTIDAVSLANGDRVLLKDQTTVYENGPYVVSGIGTAVVLTRTFDGDTAAKMSDQARISIQQGAVNGETDWELVTNNPITLGTTGLQFTRMLPAYALSQRNPRNPTPTVGGGTLGQLRQMSLDRNVAMTGQSALTSGRVQLVGGFVIPAGQPVTDVAWCSSGAATTPTNQWAGVCTTGGVIKGISADRTTEAWASTTIKQFPLASAWTPDVDTPIYVFLNVTATTVPSMAGVNYGNSAFPGFTPVFAATANTGQTTPLSNGATLAALSAVTQVLYCGWS